MFALCEAAPFLKDEAQAARLLDQLSPYIAEAHLQRFRSSSRLRTITPSPLESLSFRLTKAVLAIGIRHASLHQSIYQAIQRYLANASDVIDAVLLSSAKTLGASNLDTVKTLDVVSVTTSLLGFLDAASKHADFFAISERLDILRQLRQILNERFMVSVEGSFSTIRTSESTLPSLMQWKLYTKRYAAAGRPLGAMLLQAGFLKLLVSYSSLQICTSSQLQMADVLDVLISGEHSALYEDRGANGALIEVQSDIATESMHLLEDGSDYLRMGSTCQQRLAFSVKAFTIVTFLNCMVMDEEIADADVLVSWLEDTMADPIQMSDDTLASAVLKSMAVVARFLPASAAAMSRSLPRFIVQSGIKGDTVIVAARSLTYILQLLPQDAVIAGIYSLGNVLSAGSGGDKTATILDRVNGATKTRNLSHYTHQATSSAISLDLSGEEETATAYANIVRAIVTVANSCKDEKLIALAQTMLLQKLGRISMAVDINIIKEAAPLAVCGGAPEFKALLKLYARLGHDGVVRNSRPLLAAVCSNPHI